MTAAHAHASLQLDTPPPRISWAALGVIIALIVHGVAAVAFAAALDRRVANLEQQLPAGAIARLDERTMQIQKSIERMEPRV